MLSMRGGAKGLGPWGSLRTTKLYGRTKERLTQDEVERISAGNVFFAAAHLDDGERHRVFTRNRLSIWLLRTQCSKHYVRTRNRDVISPNRPSAS
jgi:hypothetical protein